MTDKQIAPQNSTVRKSFFSIAGAVMMISAAQLAAPVYAQSPAGNDSGVGDKASAQFTQLDKNHDAFIDKTEAAAMSDLSSMFAKADTNKDGKLSPAEFDIATKKTK